MSELLNIYERLQELEKQERAYARKQKAFDDTGEADIAYARADGMRACIREIQKILRTCATS